MSFNVENGREKKQTLSDSVWSTMPTGIKIRPTTANVLMTQFGVRMGCHALSFCCLNGTQLTNQHKSRLGQSLTIPAERRCGSCLWKVQHCECVKRIPKPLVQQQINIQRIGFAIQSTKTRCPRFRCRFIFIFRFFFLIPQSFLAICVENGFMKAVPITMSF
ncbi:hypothetical protein PsorP6_004959 [Peronosclerospora sorghi]|uniref:Uncharacterized protein n=1 Tax=Peronosclerospora sorghi TaxID=230839 RepID=A0ACC0W592_9STRA|nr:hypothetical protein PsorP6_004959 [Peronosclerospora sorghi]